MKPYLHLLIGLLFLSCGNLTEVEKEVLSEKKDSTQNTKAMDSSFSDENASELATLLKGNNLPDSVKIVEEVQLKSTKKLIPDKVEKYFHFPGGTKTEMEPAFHQFYIVFDYNQEMKKLSKTESEKRQNKYENDLKELGLVRLSQRQFMYQMQNSPYNRKQLIEKLLKKKEVRELEATYSTRYNNRYFEPLVRVEFKPDTQEKEIKELLKKYQLNKYVIYSENNQQLTAAINFSKREMLNYRFLIVAEILSNQDIVDKVYTDNIQHALAD
jgi:hypothetical protein